MDYITSDSQKLENSLNLALESSKKDRSASPSLRVGYNEADKTWELIIKYNDLQNFLSYINSKRTIRADLLIAGYAILTIPESEISALAAQPFLEYAEQPKRLIFSDLEGRLASCIPEDNIFYNTIPGASTSVRQNADPDSFSLTGQGVLIAIIDSGIDFTNSDFRNADGTTRIVFLNDLSQNRIFTSDEINAFLNKNIGSPNFDITSLEKAKDFSGHGTAVAGIATGNGAGSDNRFIGVAPDAGLLVVKLGTDIPDSFPRTTQLMKAVNWAVITARSLGKPVAINLSIGNTYGPHDGSSLLETFLDAAADIGRTVICVGNGNEGADAGHASITFTHGETGTKSVHLSIGNYETGLNLQLWKNYSAACSITLIAPDQTAYRITENPPSGPNIFLRPTASFDRSLVIETDQEEILIYIGSPAPYSINQEIYLDMIPRGSYLTDGIWTIEITKEDLNPLSMNLYLPTGITRSENTRFIEPSDSLTLTVPATSDRVISVGAYNHHTDIVPSFSGRGYVLGLQPRDLVKPDLVAPGVNIISNDLFHSYGSFTGTSFATPFVTGAAALLMEWGIVRGNDPYMYGQKVKATLHRLARPLASLPKTPNESSGYGALCLLPK